MSKFDKARWTQHKIRGLQDDDGTIIVNSTDLAKAILGDEGGIVIPAKETAIPLESLIKSLQDLKALIVSSLGEETKH